MKRNKVILMGIFVMAFGVVHGCGQENPSSQDTVISALIKKLETGLWREVVDELAEIGEPAVEPLIKVLEERPQKGSSSARANLALGKIGTPLATCGDLMPRCRVAFDRRRRVVDPLIRAVTDGTLLVTWRSGG